MKSLFSTRNLLMLAVVLALGALVQTGVIDPSVAGAIGFAGTFNFPEGTRFSFQPTSSFGSAKTVTAATNANPTVLSALAHGLVDNDEFLFLSGWEDATNTVYRADQLTVDTLSALGLDATNTRFYPAGSGVGSLQKMGTWISIPQVIGINTSGGDPRFSDVQLLASRNAIKIPTGFNPTVTVLTLAHDPADANWASMVAVSRVLSPVAFKMALGGGGTTYAYGYLAVNESPKMTVGQVNSVDATFAFLGRQISYAT